MMGEKKLSEIKAELRQMLCAPSVGVDRAKKRCPSKVETELESLCAALEAKKERPRSSKKPNGKKKPAP